jgi:hypothetical protein
MLVLLIEAPFEVPLNEAVYVHETQNNSTTKAANSDFTLGDPTPERPL